MSFSGGCCCNDNVGDLWTVEGGDLLRIPAVQKNDSRPEPIRHDLGGDLQVIASVFLKRTTNGIIWAILDDVSDGQLKQYGMRADASDTSNITSQTWLIDANFHGIITLDPEFFSVTDSYIAVVDTPQGSFGQSGANAARSVIESMAAGESQFTTTTKEYSISTYPYLLYHAATRAAEHGVVVRLNYDTSDPARQEELVGFNVERRAIDRNGNVGALEATLFSGNLQKVNNVDEVSNNFGVVWDYVADVNKDFLVIGYRSSVNSNDESLFRMESNLPLQHLEPGEYLSGQQTRQYFSGTPNLSGNYVVERFEFTAPGDLTGTAYVQVIEPNGNVAWESDGIGDGFIDEIIPGPAGRTLVTGSESNINQRRDLELEAIPGTLNDPTDAPLPSGLKSEAWIVADDGSWRTPAYRKPFPYSYEDFPATGMDIELGSDAFMPSNDYYRLWETKS